MLAATLMRAVILEDRHASSSSGPTYKLGKVGRCPASPGLTIAVFDDSGSIAMPGGRDPVGNRYEEARRAFAALRACTCGMCLGAVLHFDSPHGDAGPSQLRRRAAQLQLGRALQVPALAAGSSTITDALIKAEQLAAHYPDHDVQLLVFTDWELFDPPSYMDRVARFPGEVLAVGLGADVPLELEGANVSTLRIDYTDAPGAAARAVFRGLVANRLGSLIYGMEGGS